MLPEAPFILRYFAVSDRNIISEVPSRKPQVGFPWHFFVIREILGSDLDSVPRIKSRPVKNVKS
jgi:hypothetical protein